MANKKIKGITIEVGGDTTKLSKVLSEAEKDSNSLQKELIEVNKLLKLDPTNTELLAQKQKILKEAINATSQKLATLKDAEKQVQEQFEKGEVSEEQYRALQREIISTENALKDLEKQAQESNGSIASGVNNAVDKISEKTGTLGKKLMPVTAGLTAVGTAGVAAAMSLDDGYDTIITKTGATGEALEELNNVADNLFTNLPIEMEDAGIAVGEVNTRFQVTGETLEELSQQFIKFSQINDTDLNTSIDNVDAIMTKFEVDITQTANVLGLMTKAGQDTGISMETLQNSLKTNGAALKELGLNLPQGVNLLAQLEANGVDVTTTLAGLKKAVINATKEGKSADKAIEETIDLIKNAANETEALQTATELFGTKGAAEMTQAIREGRLSINELSASLEDYGTIVEDTFSETLDPWDDAKVATNNLKAAAADLGGTLLNSTKPIITSLVDKIKEFTKWFKNLSDSQKETIVKIIMIVAVLGPLFLLVSKIIGVGKTVVSVLGSMKKAFTALHTVIAANPIAAVIIAITALIAAIVYLYNKCEWFRNALNKIFSNIKDAVLSTGNFFKDTFKTVCEDIKKIFSALGEFFSNLWNGIKDTFTALGVSIADAISGAVKAGINGIIYFIEDTINGAINLINGAIKLINKIPGVEIGKIKELDLPKLAKGGVLTSGSAIVAEAGPELIQMVNGKTVVTPLTNTAKNTNAGNFKGDTKNEINLNIENFYNNRQQDIKELTEEVLQEAEAIRGRERRAYA